MNREIKFRAYQKSKNYIYKVLDINFEGHNQAIREVKLSNGDIVTSNRIDDLVLMQYTGLKDKNGVEIYENDLLQDLEDEFLKPLIVKWHKEYASFEFDDWNFSKSSCEKLTIIGNIYENE